MERERRRRRLRWRLWCPDAELASESLLLVGECERRRRRRRPRRRPWLRDRWRRWCVLCARLRLRLRLWCWLRWPADDCCGCERSGCSGWSGSRPLDAPIRRKGWKGAAAWECGGGAADVWRLAASTAGEELGARDGA